MTMDRKIVITLLTNMRAVCMCFLSHRGAAHYTLRLCGFKWYRFTGPYYMDSEWEDKRLLLNGGMATFAKR